MKPQFIASGHGTEYDWTNDHIYVKTSMDLTDGRVIVIEDTLKPGFHLIRHYHKVMTEIFYILEGEIEFTFDDATVRATPGMVVNIPPSNWHEVRSDPGGKLITIFSPGGFDQYLAEIASLTINQLEDEGLMTALGEKYDIWTQ